VRRFAFWQTFVLLLHFSGTRWLRVLSERHGLDLRCRLLSSHSFGTSASLALPLAALGSGSCPLFAMVVCLRYRLAYSLALRTFSSLFRPLGARTFGSITTGNLVSV